MGVADAAELSAAFIGFSSSQVSELRGFHRSPKRERIGQDHHDQADEVDHVVHCSLPSARVSPVEKRNWGWKVSRPYRSGLAAQDWTARARLRCELSRSGRLVIASPSGRSSKRGPAQPSTAGNTSSSDCFQRRCRCTAPGSAATRGRAHQEDHARGSPHPHCQAYHHGRTPHLVVQGCDHLPDPRPRLLGRQ